MDDGEPSILTGTGQLWHAGVQVAEVRYELSQSTDPSDPVSIRGRVFGIPDEQVVALFGRRVTLRSESGETADCFFADSKGGIVLTTHGWHR